MQEPLPSQYAFIFEGFERDGESVVRERVALKRYTDPQRHSLAVMWLAWKDQERAEIEAERLNSLAFRERASERRKQTFMIIITVIATVATIAAAIIAYIAWQHPKSPDDSAPIPAKSESQGRR